MEFLKNIVRTYIREAFEGETPREQKTQSNFNWQESYPTDLKSSLEISGSNVKLYHYGADGESGYLDPEFFGKNSHTASDVKQWGQKRIFFYIHKGDKEQRINGKEYIVEYPLDKLYPFNSDPYHFYEDCMVDIHGQKMVDLHGDSLGLNFNRQISCIGKKVKDAGFDGMVMNWGDTYRVDIWVKVSV